MFFGLGHLWSFWTDSWHSPGRARVLYAVFTAGFLALAVFGGIRGDVLVIVISGILAAITALLAAIAPKLASWTAPRRGQGIDL